MPAGLASCRTIASSVWFRYVSFITEPLDEVVSPARHPVAIQRIIGSTLFFDTHAAMIQKFIGGERVLLPFVVGGMSDHGWNVVVATGSDERMAQPIRFLAGRSRARMQPFGVIALMGYRACTQILVGEFVRWYRAYYHV